MSRKAIMIVVGAVSAVLVSGCGQNAPAPGDSPATQPSVFAPPEKAGAQLWAENCSRCHNLRPPQSYSNAQWQVIVHHMRLRANLTGEESRSITTFLQASN